MLSLIRIAFRVLKFLNPFSKRTSIILTLTNILFCFMLVFIGLSIAALGFRWADSLLIEILSWIRQVLNNLASIYPWTSG
jgi:hypothetical protein